MQVGQRVKARFRSLPNETTGGDNRFEVRYPLRDAVVSYIHPKGRYITLETLSDGNPVKESFHPNDLRR